MSTSPTQNEQNPEATSQMEMSDILLCLSEAMAKERPVQITIGETVKKMTVDKIEKSNSLQRVVVYGQDLDEYAFSPRSFKVYATVILNSIRAASFPSPVN